MQILQHSRSGSVELRDETERFFKDGFTERHIQPVREKGEGRKKAGATFERGHVLAEARR